MKNEIKSQHTWNFIKLNFIKYIKTDTKFVLICQHHQYAKRLACV